MPCTVVLHGLRPVPFGPAIQPLGRVCIACPERSEGTPHPYLHSSLPIVTCSTGRIVRLDAVRLSFPLSTVDNQSCAEGRCCLPFTREVGVDVYEAWEYHRTHMDTQLSKGHATFAAHPPRHVARFRANGSHTTACTRLPTARFIRHTLLATMPVIGISLAGPAAGEAEALGSLP